MGAPPGCDYDNLAARFASPVLEENSFSARSRRSFNSNSHWCFVLPPNLVSGMMIDIFTCKIRAQGRMGSGGGCSGDRLANTVGNGEVRGML